MRKIKEVLRLKYELNLGQRQIARSCSVGLATVNEYLARAEQAGVGWPLPEGWEEAELLVASRPVLPFAASLRLGFCDTLDTESGTGAAVMEKTPGVKLAMV